jgi:hypothetical protein
MFSSKVPVVRVPVQVLNSFWVRGPIEKQIHTQHFCTGVFLTLRLYEN